MVQHIQFLCCNSLVIPVSFILFVSLTHKMTSPQSHSCLAGSIQLGKTFDSPSPPIRPSFPPTKQSAKPMCNSHLPAFVVVKQANLVDRSRLPWRATSRHRSAACRASSKVAGSEPTGRGRRKGRKAWYRGLLRFARPPKDTSVAFTSPGPGSRRIVVVLMRRVMVALDEPGADPGRDDEDRKTSTHTATQTKRWREVCRHGRSLAST